jgi:uncharacterized Zn finger protein (UPF0148 family)
MEEEAHENDGELLCPECDTPVAKIKEVDLGSEEPGLKSGIDVQPEYVVGARKLKSDFNPKTDSKEFENISIEEASDIMEELEDTKESLKGCQDLDDDEINRIVAEYREDLILENSILDEKDIQKLVDEKEADLRFNLTKAINAILRGQQWLLNRGGDEEEYSALGMFDRFC